MKRREFITLLGGAAAWPLAAGAQQSGKLPTIGYLGATSASGQSQWTMAFTRRLHELGWAEGRTITVEYRWAEGLAAMTAAGTSQPWQLPRRTPVTARKRTLALSRSLAARARAE